MLTCVERHFDTSGAWHSSVMLINCCPSKFISKIRVWFETKFVVFRWGKQTKWKRVFYSSPVSRWGAQLWLCNDGHLPLLPKLLHFMKSSFDSCLTFDNCSFTPLLFPSLLFSFARVLFLLSEWHENLILFAFSDFYCAKKCESQKAD